MLKRKIQNDGNDYYETFFVFHFEFKIDEIMYIMNLIQPLVDEFHDVRVLQAFKSNVIVYIVILFVWHQLYCLEFHVLLIKN